MKVLLSCTWYSYEELTLYKNSKVPYMVTPKTSAPGTRTQWGAAGGHGDSQGYNQSITPKSGKALRLGIRCATCHTARSLCGTLDMFRTLIPAQSLLDRTSRSWDTL